MKLAKIVVFLCAASCGTLLWAESAPWYLWRSPEDPSAICSQISPGDGWVIIKGPYRDAVCKTSGVQPKK